MGSPDVLVVEPDAATRNQVGSMVRDLALEPIFSGSVEEARERVRGEGGHLTAIIADVATLLPPDRRGGDWTNRVAELRARIEQLRALQRASRLPGGEPNAEPWVPVILTSAEDDAAVHAAAIDAGAEAFVRATGIAYPVVLRSYLTRYATRRTARVVRLAARPRPIAETFDLPDDDLRNGRTGRWDAKRIAPVLGVDLADLVRAIGAHHSAVARTPDSEALQPQLGPFATVITVARQAVAPDGDDADPADETPEQARARTDERLRTWLRRSQPALGSRSPLDALLEPGLAPAVEQWVARVWLGEADDYPIK